MSERKPFDRKQAKLEKRKKAAEQKKMMDTHDWNSTWIKTKPGAGYWQLGNCKNCGIHYDRFRFWPATCTEQVIKDVIE